MVNNVCFNEYQCLLTVKLTDRKIESSEHKPFFSQSYISCYLLYIYMLHRCLINFRSRGFSSLFCLDLSLKQKRIYKAFTASWCTLYIYQSSPSNQSLCIYTYICVSSISLSPVLSVESYCCCCHCKEKALLLLIIMAKQYLLILQTHTH